MALFCTNCGAQLPEETNTCPNCNTVVEAAPVAAEAPAAEEKKEAKKIDLSDTVAKVMAFIKKNPVVSGLIAGGVVLVLVVLIVLGAVLGSVKGYEKTLKNYTKMLKGDVTYESIEAMAPEAYWDYMEEEYELDLKEQVEELLEEDYLEEMKEELEDDYGKNFRVSYKVTDEDELDKDDLNDIRDSLKEKYDIPKKSVTKGYELEVEFSIKGSEDEDSDEMDLTVIKIDGKWYIYPFAAGNLF